MRATQPRPGVRCRPSAPCRARRSAAPGLPDETPPTRHAPARAPSSRAALRPRQGQARQGRGQRRLARRRPNHLDRVQRALEDPGHHRQRRRRVVETLGIGERQRARVALHGGEHAGGRRDAATAGGMRMSRTWRVSERVKKRAVHTPDASARTARAGRRRARRFRSIPGPGPGTESASCAAAPRHCTAAPAFPPESRNRKTRITEFTCPSSTSPSSAPASAAWPPRHPPGRPERFSL